MSPPSPLSPLVPLVLLACGVGSAWAVCWPFAFGGQRGEPIWYLQILLLIPLLHGVAAARTARRAFALGLVFATAWLGTTFWWLYISMHTYGGLPAVMAVAAVLLLAAALGLFYALALALWWKVARSKPTRSTPALSTPAQSAAAFAALWAMAEMARGTWLTGFGWGGMGYAHVVGPLQIWIPLLGAYAVAALAAWCAATLALIGRAGWGQRLALVLLLGAGWLIQTPQFTTSTGTLSAVLLQGNIPQDEKFSSGSGIPRALAWYAEQLQQAQAKPAQPAEPAQPATRAQLILAPETAIPLLPEELPPGYLQSLQPQTSNSAIMVGIPLGNMEQGYTNSVIALQANSQQAWRYDKHHLVPFGEFIPPWFKWFTRMMNIPLGDFNRGAIGQASFAWKGQRIAPNICYEDLFGEELAARFVDANNAPTLFANVSNLGWFGNSIAIDQHLQISRMRALEFQRPFLRATNTGATAILNYQGQVVASLPRFSVGVLQHEVEGRSGTTPYAWWAARLGLWPLWLLALAVLVWGVRGVMNED